MELTKQEKLDILRKAGSSIQSSEYRGLCSAIYEAYRDKVCVKEGECSDPTVGELTIQQFLATIFPYFTRENAISDGAPDKWANNPYWWPPTESFTPNRLQFLQKIREDVERE